jgi:nicotinamide-nucleotide amidase
MAGEIDPVSPWAAEIAEAAGALIRGLTELGRTVAVAESLTGGLVAAALTAVPGASVVFRGSLTAYATDIKGSLLGVDWDLLAAEGAVHPEVAVQMSIGVRGMMGADVGLATTGVAGPTRQDGRPVGLVYVAVCDYDGAVMVTECRFSGDRDAVRRQSVLEVLRLALPG